VCPSSGSLLLMERECNLLFIGLFRHYLRQQILKWKICLTIFKFLETIIRNWFRSFLRFVPCSDASFHPWSNFRSTVHNWELYFAGFHVDPILRVLRLFPPRRSNLICRGSGMLRRAKWKRYGPADLSQNESIKRQRQVTLTQDPFCRRDVILG
jgi:hypothetical protein